MYGLEIQKAQEEFRQFVAKLRPNRAHNSKLFAEDKVDYRKCVTVSRAELVEAFLLHRPELRDHEDALLKVGRKKVSIVKEEWERVKGGS